MIFRGATKFQGSPFYIHRCYNQGSITVPFLFHLGEAIAKINASHILSFYSTANCIHRIISMTPVKPSDPPSSGDIYDLYGRPDGEEGVAEGSGTEQQNMLLLGKPKKPKLDVPGDPAVEGDCVGEVMEEGEKVEKEKGEELEGNEWVEGVKGEEQMEDGEGEVEGEEVDEGGMEVVSDGKTTPTILPEEDIKGLIQCLEELKSCLELARHNTVRVKHYNRITLLFSSYVC